ncbi:hypothetical protein BJY59DRAFT_656066, partial [Rhodotorula toruloides]
MISKLPDNIAGQLLDLTARQIWVHLTSRFDLGNKESIQSILAAIRSLKAKNLEAVGTFLDEHEEILSRAREIDFPLVRSIPDTASDAERSQYSTLHYVYSDFILEGLPSDTEWKAWTSVYRQADSSTFAPREVLDKVRAEYNRRRANAAASSGRLLLNGNGKASSSSSTAAATVGKENPRHSVERCWQNPDNPNNRLNQSGSKGKGKEKEKEKSKKDDKKDKDGKVVTLAVATVASSVDGDFDGSKAPTDWHLDTCASRHIVAERRYFTSYRLLTTPIVTASGPSLEGVGVNIVSATLALLATPQEERLKAVELAHRRYGHPSKAAMRDLLCLGEVKGFTTSDLDVFFSKSCPPCRTG